MLILSRRRGEEIVIDGEIRLTVLAVRGKTVHLGVLAPPTVSVQRREVQNRISSQLGDQPARLPVIPMHRRQRSLAGR
jgi:carbon storage regulator